MQLSHAYDTSFDGAPESLTESDLQARRLLDIAMTLESSNEPVSSRRLKELHYPAVTEESFRRMFNRDRQRLALCGVIVRRTNRPPDQALWEIDDASSFLSDEQLTPRESVVLDVACAQLASDPSFPLYADLRIALAKIDRSFDSRSPIDLSGSASPRDARLDALMNAYLARHAVQVSYRRADMIVVERQIEIFGFFSVSDHTYAVAKAPSDNEEPTEEQIHSYRIDRFLKVRECPRSSYTIPSSFDIHDYMLLPFQIGPKLYDATFYVAPDVLSRVIHDLQNTAHVFSQRNSTVLCFAVSDEDKAAAWSIAEGIIPIQPRSLVLAWRSTLNNSLTRRQSDGQA